MTNHTQEPTKHNPLNNSVSEKLTIISNAVSLDMIANEIFRTAGTCRYVDENINDYAELRRVQIEMLINDAQRLLDACNLALSSDDSQPKPEPKKISLFNVLNSAKQQIDESVTFDQAKQYQNCIVKFSCMSEVSA